MIIKTALIIIAGFFLSLNAYSQKAEVLYFKATLPCCPGRACNQLEAAVKSVIEDNYSDKDVVFKTIHIAMADNAELVEKHNGRSQKVVIVAKKDETVTDVSDIVRTYSRNRNLEDLKTKLTEQINSTIE